MSRHGLPFALALIIAVGGCQNPWRGGDDYAQIPGGLEQPDSLIAFPSAVARYADAEPSGVRQANVQPDDTIDSVVLASDEITEAQGSRRALDTLLEDAGEVLRKASLSEDQQQQADYLEMASKKYREVLDQDPENAVAHHRMGVVGDLQKDYLLAETHYRKALKQTPHNPDLLSDIGYSYQLQERYDVAEKFLDRALHINPTHSRAANNLGKLAAERGSYDEAYAFFRRAGTPEHADRAMAYFFPDGRPIEAIVRTTDTPTQPSDTDFSEMTSPDSDVGIKQTADSLIENLSQSVDEQAKAARERVQIVQEEIEKQLDVTDIASSRLPSVNARSNQTITASVNDAVMEIPVIRPKPTQPGSIVRPRPDLASAMSAALEPVPQTVHPQPAQPHTTALVSSTQTPAGKAPWQSMSVAPTYSLDELQVRRLHMPARLPVPPAQLPHGSGRPVRAEPPTMTEPLTPPPLPNPTLTATPVPTPAPAPIPVPQPAPEPIRAVPVPAPRPAATAIQRPPVESTTTMPSANARTHYLTPDADGLWNAQPVDPASIQRDPSDRDWSRPTRTVSVDAIDTTPSQYPFATIVNEPAPPSPPPSQIKPVAHESMRPEPKHNSTDNWPGLKQLQQHSAFPDTYPGSLSTGATEPGTSLRNQQIPQPTGLQQVSPLPAAVTTPQAKRPVLPAYEPIRAPRTQAPAAYPKAVYPTADAGGPLPTINPGK